tara:strand:- start:11721 stop:11882 length:162 start_codon:yes stop_codon:yes gene_type:complete
MRCAIVVAVIMLGKLTNNDKKDEITILQAMGVPKLINNKKDIVRTNTPKNSIT